MSPIDWATRPLKKYADFSGRAPRAEFWWYMLMLIIAFVVLMIVESVMGLGKVFTAYGPLALVLMVATFVPSLAVQVRRLHDTNRSGWWLLAFYLPYGVSVALTVRAMQAMGAGATDMSSVGIAGIVMLVSLLIGIALLVFYCLRGTQGDNRFGADPYAGEPAYA